MSTPKPSLVKWVPRILRDDGMIAASEVAHYTHLTLVEYVKVADLAEVVEGLRQATEGCTTADSAYSVGYRDGRMDALTVLLTQLEAHREEG